MSLFNNQRETNYKACLEMIEAVLQGFGLDPAASRLAEEGGAAWTFRRGSAHVYVFLSPGEKAENYLQVIAPVMRPSSDSRRDALFPRLLELNAGELTGAAFGLREGDVVLTTDRATTGLDRVEVEEMIRRIGASADHYDDLLVTEFGGSRHSDL